MENASLLQKKIFILLALVAIIALIFLYSAGKLAFIGIVPESTQTASITYFKINGIEAKFSDPAEAYTQSDSTNSITVPEGTVMNLAWLTKYADKCVSIMARSEEEGYIYKSMWKNNNNVLLNSIPQGYTAYVADKGTAIYGISCAGKDNAAISKFIRVVGAPKS